MMDSINIFLIESKIAHRSAEQNRHHHQVQQLQPPQPQQHQKQAE